MLHADLSRHTHMEEKHTQMLVPKSHWEMIFHVAHYNPMTVHMEYDKTLDQIMAQPSAD